MSYDVNVYTKGFSSQLLPSIKSKLADMGLDCDFHPEIVGTRSMASGFFPVRMKVLRSDSKQYADFGVDILTGFEMRTASFAGDELGASGYAAQVLVRRQSFVQRVLTSCGWGQQGTGCSGAQAGSNADIIGKLKRCDQDVFITCGQTNASELRIALFFALALAQLTDGVVHDNYRNRYLDSSAAEEQLPRMVGEYERSLHKSSWTLQEFAGWH